MIFFAPTTYGAAQQITPPYIGAGSLLLVFLDLFSFKALDVFAARWLIVVQRGTKWDEMGWPAYTL